MINLWKIQCLRSWLLNLGTMSTTIRFWPIIIILSGLYLYLKIIFLIFLPFFVFMGQFVRFKLKKVWFTWIFWSLLSLIHELGHLAILLRVFRTWGHRKALSLIGKRELIGHDSLSSSFQLLLSTLYVRTINSVLKLFIFE